MRIEVPQFHTLRYQSFKAFFSALPVYIIFISLSVLFSPAPFHFRNVSRIATKYRRALFVMFLEEDPGKGKNGDTRNNNFKDQTTRHMRPEDLLHTKCESSGRSCEADDEYDGDSSFDCSAADGNNN